jgi:16S rRNA C1402 (ribose-2'-O) methylase RsmI
MPERPTNLNDKVETKLVPLEDALPNKKVIIGAELTKQEEEELLDILSKSKDIFAWLASDL